MMYILVNLKKWTKGIIKSLSFPPDIADNYNDTDKKG